ncbi:MAG: ATP-binding cassette domain-containing protein [Pseudoxanthomonas suwonensis]|nr:ATP-binding cassette domain-containing protein [Pseudoxanthomonas suwonensis]
MLEFGHVRGDFHLRSQAQVGAGVTGICGPSGSGKSTLLALLAGLQRPRHGRIALDGDVLLDTETGVFVPPWKRRVGLVFQDGQLFPHMNVRENLLYGFRRLPPAQRAALGQDGGMPKAFDAVLAMLELAPLLARRPTLLSGGERQRVALGRALLHAPRLLLLDEPLSALDDRLRAQILPFLMRIKRESAVPMVYVSHRMDELEFHADRVLAMDAGRLGPA